MNFESTSSFNLWMNLISGNILPMTGGDTSFPFYWKLNCAFSWFCMMTQMLGLIVGCFFMPKEKILRDGMISMIIIIEVTIILMRIITQKTLVQDMIRKLNDMMCVQDDLMQEIITTTLKSMKAPLQMYWIFGGIAVFVWSCMPIPLVFQRNTFYYVDVQTPIVLSKEPYTTVEFVLINIILVVNNMSIFVKKVAVDVYMTHMVLMITVQHLYTSQKLVTIFREGNRRYSRDSIVEDYRSRTDHVVEKELKILCRHHINTINLTLQLKKLLSLNFSLIYVNGVFRFCCVMFLVFSIPSAPIVQGLMIIIFMCGEVAQLYVLCASVHQLLDASTNITDKAFHEDWYRFGPCVKRMFILIIMAGSVGFKLSTFERFNLSLPSFMTILNQSYSIALLILKIT